MKKAIYLHLPKEPINSPFHILRDQAMHMRRWLNVIHPVKLFRSLPNIRSSNTRVPLLIGITRIAIAVARQRLRQTITILTVHQLHHEPEDVVVDELAAVF